MPASPFPQGTVLPNGDELGRLVRAVDPMFWIHVTRQRRRALPPCAGCVGGRLRSRSMASPLEPTI
jgi:hypothetical protein